MDDIFSTAIQQKIINKIDNILTNNGYVKIGETEVYLLSSKLPYTRKVTEEYEGKTPPHICVYNIQVIPFFTYFDCITLNTTMFNKIWYKPTDLATTNYPKIKKELQEFENELLLKICE